MELRGVSVLAFLVGLAGVALISGDAVAAQCGKAAWYDLDGQTASGERSNGSMLAAAHRTLPFGTRVRVENLSNGREVIVRVNDRGPFVGGRVIDVTRAAAEELGMIKSGIAKVRVSVVDGKAKLDASCEDPAPRVITAEAVASERRKGEGPARSGTGGDADRGSRRSRTLFPPTKTPLTPRRRPRRRERSPRHRRRTNRSLRTTAPARFWSPPSSTTRGRASRTLPGPRAALRRPMPRPSPTSRRSMTSRTRRSSPRWSTSPCPARARRSSAKRLRRSTARWRSASSTPSRPGKRASELTVPLGYAPSEARGAVITE